jgi:hypothetical protein
MWTCHAARRAGLGASTGLGHSFGGPFDWGRIPTSSVRGEDPPAKRGKAIRLARGRNAGRKLLLLTSAQLRIAGARSCSMRAAFPFTSTLCTLTRSASFHSHILTNVSAALSPSVGRASDKREHVDLTISVRTSTRSSLFSAAVSALRSFLARNSSILFATSSLLRRRGAFCGCRQSLHQIFPFCPSQRLAHVGGLSRSHVTVAG